MKSRVLAAALAALAAALCVPGPGAAQPRPAAKAGQNWTLTAARTPEGGFRMGNPNAPVKVIEYLSLTCPHCAAFAREGGERLFQSYVRSGRVSVEYRNFPLNGYDLAAAFVSRCASPREYFNMTHYLLGHQAEWMGRIDAIPAAQRDELRSMTPIQAMARIVSLIGLDRIAAQHGITAAGQRTCLASQAGLDRIERMAQAGRGEHGVEGTPTFMVNGRTVGPQTWATLEPMLNGH